MTKLKLAHEARNDIAQIGAYVSNELDNPEAASRIQAQILKRARTLIEFPELGALLSTIAPVQEKHRFLVTGSYIIIYRYDAQQNIVFVVRVLHGKRDFSKILIDEYSGEELATESN